LTIPTTIFIFELKQSFVVRFAASGLSQLHVKEAILDGEIVCMDEHSVSQFNQLLHRGADSIFYAFDLLWLNGKDYRPFLLVARKKRLQRLVERNPQHLMYAQHIETNGKEFFAGNLSPRPRKEL
jgi:bifunctional non-homologous end joining protein LigD